MIGGRISKFLAFVAALALGLVAGGLLTMYFIVGVPRAPSVPGQPITQLNSAPKGVGKVVVSLDQSFFDGVLSSILAGPKSPSFPLRPGAQNKSASGKQLPQFCDQSLNILREGSGVRTSLLLEKGRIEVPIAFKGSVEVYGVCLTFSGWSKSSLTLKFDDKSDTVFGQLEVQTVNIDGVPAFAEPFVTTFVQDGINRSVNPVKVIKGDQLRFSVPVKATGGELTARITKVNAEILEGKLKLTVEYEFDSKQESSP